jgi:hypothetical protein
MLDGNRIAVVAVKRLGGAFATTAAAGTGVAVCSWVGVFVVIAALAAGVFVIWWVLGDSDRSTRLKEILSAIVSAPPR